MWGKKFTGNLLAINTNKTDRVIIGGNTYHIPMTELSCFILPYDC